MRRGNKPDFLMEEDNTFVGINLDCDFCAEHEWGIAEIRLAFGIKDATDGIIGLGSVLGVDARKVNRFPNNMAYKEYADKDLTTVLFFNYYGFDANSSKEQITTELTLFKESLACAWDGGSFGIRTAGQEGRSHLKELYDALVKKDAVIFLGGHPGPFSNAGLVIAITSRLPDEVKKKWHDVDLDYFNLRKAAKDTGIESYLKSKGMQWHTLSPRWKDEKKQEVVFWLNPQQQDINNFGWFTVEQLKEWADGKGDIPKKVN